MFPEPPDIHMPLSGRRYPCGKVRLGSDPGFNRRAELLEGLDTAQTS
jgi:hypothetical protein